MPWRYTGRRMKRPSPEVYKALGSIYRFEGRVEPLSHLVSRLVEKGWVYRAPGSTDISITNLGYAVLCTLPLVKEQADALRAVGDPHGPSKAPMHHHTETSLRRRGLIRGAPPRLTYLGRDRLRVLNGEDPHGFALPPPEA